jgi:nitrogen fixation protein NifZ
MTRPLFELGDAVRVIRHVRNDGTWPGVPRGELLVRRGRTGFVRDVGTFLQDQIIYSVHFLDEGRVVGCREEELIPEAAPWVESRFEFRERVAAAKDLAVNGQVIVPRECSGQVIRVLREGDDGVVYHVLFGARLWRVPESALKAAPA